MTASPSPSVRRRLEDCLQKVWRTQGLLSTVLLPLAWVYGGVSRRHLAQGTAGAWRAPIPVIVIGNILVGGTGKTPVTQAVCAALLAAGLRPGLISRGYGTVIGADAHLSDTRHDSRWLGDEPALLHAATGAPIAVHPHRTRAAQALLAAHPDLDVLMADDGLQHTALARDLEIIVQDGRGVGNGRLLPAGPLREPPARRLQADWLITQLGPGEAPPPSLPGGSRPAQVSFGLQPDHLTQLASGQTLVWSDWYARYGQAPCSAAAGIGQPQRFFAMLRHAGLTLAHTLATPDHQAPAPATLQAFPPGPILITAKDAIKYTVPYDPRVWVVQAAPVFSDPAWLDVLAQRVRALSGHRPPQSP